MDHIYSRAANVCVWLGEADHRSATAFRHIEEVLKLQHFEQTVREDKAKAWASLAELMKRDWFSRRWVVQEIAYARKASVHCGAHTIDWTHMSDAVALFASRADDIAQLFKGHKEFGNRASYLGDIEALGANRLVVTISKLFRRADDGRKVERLLSLESLISNLSAFKSSSPHDIIYSVLSLAKDVITSAKPSASRDGLKVPIFSKTQHDSTRASSGLRQNGQKRKADRLEADPYTFVEEEQRRDRRPSVSSATGERPSLRSRRNTIFMPMPRRLSISTQFPVQLGVPSAMTNGVDPLASPAQEISATSLSSVLPATELEAIQAIEKYGYEPAQFQLAVEKVRTYKNMLSVGLPAQSSAGGGQGQGTDDIVGADFWNQDVTAALEMENGIAAVAHKLLQRLSRENLLKKDVIQTLRHRVIEKTFHVDYSNKSFFDVCKEFITLTIRSSKSLDMLCRPWAPPAEELLRDHNLELPSWVCHLDKSPFRPEPEGNFSRVNADLLVGMPDSNGRTYHASATTKPDDANFGQFGEGEQTRSLFVYGFVLDRIDHLRVQALEGNMPREWLDISEWTDTTKDPPESFWRTLVGDRDDKSNNPPSYYRRACRHAFAQRVEGGSLNTEQLIHSAPGKIMIDYLGRVQSVVFNRRLMKTKKGQRLGLVPHDARENDYICILRGCSVPVVLRKVSDDDDSDEEDFSPSESEQLVSPTFNNKRRRMMPEQVQVSPILHPAQQKSSPTRARANVRIRFDRSSRCKLIGESYVHGVMDGEAFRIRDKNKLPDYEFELI